MSRLEPVLIIAAQSQTELIAALHRGKSAIDKEGGFRLAILNPSPERIAKAEKIIGKGRASHGLQDIWYSPAGMLLSGGKLAFMYPGIDSLGRPDVTAVSQHFRIPARASVVDDTLESRGAEVFYTSDLYSKILERLEIKPSLMLGHSLGEWSAVLASGIIGSDTVESVVETLQPGMLPVPGVVFAALGCSVEQARGAIEGLSRIEVSHDNCPHQSIICGDEESIDTAVARLTSKRIMCQKLDFRSGFHTSMFRDFVGPLAHNINTMRLSKAKLPVWSATTCRPYPSDEKELRHLLVQHLLESVRFRELTQILHAEGARVFVQVGAGSLPGFINDTLRGLPHLCLSTATPTRDSLDQLQRFGLALFVEGANLRIDLLADLHDDAFIQAVDEPVATILPFTPRAAPKSDDLTLPRHSVTPDLMTELQACFADIQLATLDIVAALQAVPAFSKKIVRTLTLKDRPELMDHCFYKQKKGWKNIHDLFPVMPMTASIDLLLRLAHDLFVDRKVIAIEDISASRWLAVEQPKTIEIEIHFDGRNRLKINIVGHFVGTVVIADQYTHAPSPELEAMINPRASSIPARSVYDGGWLFHGPAYQGISAFRAVGDNGIQGTIRASRVPGALLDNVGQIAGIWIMQAMPVDKYAMPIRIRKISFFGPQPERGDVDCNVRCERVRARDIMFNMELSHEGHIWATIEGWEKWRFECDDKLWNFLLAPGRAMLSAQKDSFTFFEREFLTDTICEDLAKRYLREAEREVYQKLGKKRQSWICGRIAAKDAIRYFLWTNGYAGDIFPAEIWIENDASGKPVVSEMPGDILLSVSISHKEGMGVANVSRRGDIGIDIEKIEKREASFEKTVFSSYEMSILPGVDRSEWITRFWSAKEAFAKSTGLGLQGDPRKFPIEEIRPEAIRIQSTWVRSIKHGAYIVSQKEN